MLRLDTVERKGSVRKMLEILRCDYIAAPHDGSCENMPVIWIWQGEREGIR